VNVPSDKSLAPSLPADASSCIRLSSAAISNNVRFCTFFTLGTMRPLGVSIATPMLCAARCTTSVHSGFTWALRDGNSRRASDVA